MENKLLAVWSEKGMEMSERFKEIKREQAFFRALPSNEGGVREFFFLKKKKQDFFSPRAQPSN